MTQKEFNDLKTWVEKITGLTFDGVDCDGDDECVFTSEGAYFSKTIPDSENILTLFFSDKECRLVLLPTTHPEINIYKTDARNSHQCVDIFNHMYFYN